MQTIFLTPFRAKIPLLLTVAFFATFAVQGAPFQNLPMKLLQPDGTVIYCLVSGDEFINWLHDEEGYTIIQHPETGYYVYAVVEENRIAASDLIVGKVNPADVQLKKHINISEEEVKRRRQVHFEKMQSMPARTSGGLKLQFGAPPTQSNELSNLVIFIQFAGEDISDEEFAFYESMYNNPDGNSLIHYFQEVSNNQLTINSTFLPETSNGFVTWYTDSEPRAYYQPYNAITNPNGFDPDATEGEVSRTYREHQLLKRAIEATRNQLPTDFEIDAIGDGMVDCVSFIVSGGPDGWNELLWPHRWSLWSEKVYIQGKRVWDYTFQLQFNSKRDARMVLGTVAHEMFHIIGAPDLYRFESSTITPVGIWDLMAFTTTIPQQMTAYMKHIYGGWIESIPMIKETGTYELNPLQADSNNSFMIPSSNNHSEFFMVEYRNNVYEYDVTLPGSGLIVYRINTRAEGRGNAGGPPDELYVYRPNGTNAINGDIGSAYFSQNVGRTDINSTTSSKPFLSDGSEGGLSISNIGSVGQTMSFIVNIDYDYPIGILHYKSNGVLSFGSGDNPRLFSVAAKFTPDDLEEYAERYLTTVEFRINSGGGNSVTAKVWEGSDGQGPGELIYFKDISAEVELDQWTIHQLDRSILIKPDTDYWIGYQMNSTGGYPIGTDLGALEQGKGNWVKWNDTWQQITELNASLNRNLLVAGVVEANSLASSIATSRTIYGQLKQNFPNPFGDVTSIDYSIQQPAVVTLVVYNIFGQVVETLVSESQGVGDFSVPFYATNLPVGVYLYQLKIDNGAGGSETKRMIIGR